MRRPKTGAVLRSKAGCGITAAPAEGNFRTMPVQTVTATTPSGSRPAVTAHPEQKLLAPRPLFTAAREVKTIVPVSSVAPVTPPRPLRTGEQTAALWIAPYIDNQDVYHQPSGCFCY